MIIEKNANSKKMEMFVRSNRSMSRFLHFDSSAASTNWKLVRLVSTVSYALVPKAKGVKNRKIRNSIIKGYECLPDNMDNNDIIICIHGGGLLCGSAFGSLGFASDIARHAGSRVYVLDYPLAPEHQYPGAMNSVFESYKEIIRMYPDSNIFVTGESAGAYLTIELTCMAIKSGIKVPTAIFPHSPVVDLGNTLDKSYYEINDSIIRDGVIEAIKELYCPNEDAHSWQISPYYFNELSSFPPVILSCDGSEYLRADCEAFYNLLLKHSVDVKLYICHNTYHAFAATGSLAPESGEILADCVAKMRSFR